MSVKIYSPRQYLIYGLMGEIAEGMDTKGVFPDINAAVPVMYKEKLIEFSASLLKCSSWKYVSEQLL